MLNLEVVGQGATSTIYRDGNTAIKLYVNAHSDEADNEAERQRFAYNAGLPVPAVYDVRRLDKNSVALDMEYIVGQPRGDNMKNWYKEKFSFNIPIVHYINKNELD